MKNKSINRTLTANKMVLAGLGIGVLYWILESAMHALVFHRGNLVERIFAPGLGIILVRLLVMGLLLVLAVYAQFVITERKQAEEALRESEARFRSLFDGAEDHIFIVDQNLRYVTVNPSALKASGFTLADCVGKGPRELFPEDAEFYLSHYRQAFETGEPIWFERELRLPDGFHWFSVTLSPIKDARGRVIGLTGISRDITERKQAEEALRDSRRMLQTVLDSIPSTVFWKDRDSIYLGANRALLEAVGLKSSEEVVGKSDYDLPGGKEQADSFREDDRRVMESGIPEYDIIEPYLRADGTHAWAKTNKVPLRDTEGKVVGVLGTSEDITERKRAEEALRESEEKFRTIFESVPISMIVIDKDGIMVEVSPHQVVHTARGLTPREGYIGKSLITHPTIVGAGLSDTYRKLIKGEPFDLKDVYFPSVQRGTEGYYFNIKGVPLFKEGEVIGAITVHEEITERKRAEEALRCRAEELASLQATVLEITAPHDLPTLLHTIVERAVQLLDARGGGMYLCDPGRREVRCVVSYNTPHDYTGTILEYGEGAAGTVAQTGEPLIIDDYRVWGRRAAVYEEEQPFTTVLSAPMIWQDQVTGVIHILDDVESRHFTEADLALLTLFANHAAIAIENARLFEQVQAGQEQLRDLAGYLQTAREEERTQIAREIHDEFGQALSALNMDLSWLSKRLPADQPYLAKKASAMSDLIDSTIQTMRRVATELRPGLLDDLGLAATIEWQVQEFAERTGIDCDLYLSDEEIVLERDLATAIFRIFQETLTNVARHAEATKVHVELEDRPHELVLIVRDNGKGIAESQVFHPRSLGLMGMRERAHFWGGEVAFQGIPGRGTTVTVRIPNAECRMRNAESFR